MKKILIFLSVLSVLLLTACPWTTVMSYDITGFRMKETENAYVFSWQPIDISQTKAHHAKALRTEHRLCFRNSN